MKGLLFFPKVLIMIFFANMSTAQENKSVLIAQKSTLEIMGTSNVADFACQYNVRKFSEPISIKYDKQNDLIRFEKCIMILENSGFDCGGRAINKDFHGLLKSDKYPLITLKLIEIKTKPNQQNKADALVEIEIAGLSHSYRMQTEILYNGHWNISGQLKLNIVDFELEAPRKMLGLIKVSENIEISFNLIINEC